MVDIKKQTFSKTLLRVLICNVLLGQDHLALMMELLGKMPKKVCICAI